MKGGMPFGNTSMRSVCLERSIIKSTHKNLGGFEFSIEGESDYSGKNLPGNLLGRGPQGPGKIT
jgi:hypothetical protein